MRSMRPPQVPPPSEQAAEAEQALGGAHVQTQPSMGSGRSAQDWGPIAGARPAPSSGPSASGLPTSQQSEGWGGPSVPEEGWGAPPAAAEGWGSAAPPAAEGRVLSGSASDGPSLPASGTSAPARGAATLPGQRYRPGSRVLYCETAGIGRNLEVRQLVGLRVVGG